MIASSQPFGRYTVHMSVGQVSTGLEGNSAVIPLQIVMVSPGTHFAKNHESLSITNRSQLKNKEF